jgi:hypothetical protein
MLSASRGRASLNPLVLFARSYLPAINQHNPNTMQVITMSSPELQQIISEAVKGAYLQGRAEAGIQAAADPEEWVLLSKIVDECHGLICQRTIQRHTKTGFDVRRLTAGNAIQRKEIPRLLTKIANGKKH